MVKSGAEELLEKKLSSLAAKKKYGIIVLSSVTDPYSHPEDETQLTKRLLEIILRYRFPVHIITRSHRVERDFDLLHQIREQAILPDDLKEPLRNNGAFITFSFSTVNDDVAKIFEPGATPPSQRLRTMKAAADNGFLTGVSFMPFLPWISDTKEELEKSFAAVRDHGANYFFPSTLQLHSSEPTGNRTKVFEAVRKHFPQLLPKYEKLYAAGNDLPKYYGDAFYKKISVMMKEYGLRMSIL